jgi:hypothetical protein
MKDENLWSWVLGLGSLVFGSPPSSFIVHPSSFDFGARGEIRASHKADLKSAAFSNWATRARCSIHLSLSSRSGSLNIA